MDYYNVSSVRLMRFLYALGFEKESYINSKNKENWRFKKSNPYVFDNDKLNNIQLNRIPKDKSKHSYIKNNYNIEILYLWESDIIDNPELCKMLIKQYINSDGILENYNSFNYSNVGENILLKENIIIPYQDMNSCEYKKIS